MPGESATIVVLHIIKVGVGVVVFSGASDFKVAGLVVLVIIGRMMWYQVCI